MVTIMNQYVSNMNLIYDDITKSILCAALKDNEFVQSENVMIRNNKFIVDVKLYSFSPENVTMVMNYFMNATRFPYSAIFLRYNEGTQIRYRYATCQENKQGYYCDVVFN